MRADVTHKSNFTFETKIRNHTFMMDTQTASGGNNTGPSPKELLLAGVIGCTAMDVVALLKKDKIVPTKLVVSGDAEPRSKNPRVFTGVDIVFEAEGADVSPEKLNEAAHLSLTKFCGVSAMITKVVPIRYRVTLNGKDIGQGEAQFEI